MADCITGIDHTVILVRDLDSARDVYAGLGFTVSPRGLHSPHMGTANHTIMLEEDYFELLGVLAPTAQNERWRKLLETREGLSGIALRTPDAGAAYRALREKGIEASPPNRFSRPVELAGGKTGEAAFSVTKLPPEATPGTSMFVCGHLTRDMVWLPDLMRHRNTACGIAAVIAVADDPAAFADAYRAIFGAASVTAGDGVLAVETGSAPIHFYTPAALAQRYGGIAFDDASPPLIAGLALKVRDLGAVARCLDAAGTTPVPGKGALLVPPRASCGVLLEFRAA